jgi:hypothetical protein
MKAPPLETLAHSLSDTHRTIAVDLLRAAGHTKRSALKALSGRGACKDTWR